MNASPRVVNDRLGAWSLYFAAKLFLYGFHHIGFDLGWNLAFFVVILATAPGPASVSPARRRARQAGLALAGALLLWRDSWLPSIGGELAFLSENEPTAGFMLAFLARSLVSWQAAALAALLGSVAWLRRKVHMTWIVLAAFFCAGILRTADANLSTLDGRLQAFYESEARRSVRFSIPQDAPPFDVVVLQICSLASDDLSAAGIADDPFWNGFDILLTRFNTVTSHSTPATLRLLRSPCGQVKHDDLYRAPAPECALFARLQGLGFRTWVESDNPVLLSRYGQSLRDFGGLDLTPPLEGLPQTLVSFDGSPIFDEAAMLERWWAERLASGAPRAALFSNFQVLHGGAHSPTEKGWWRRTREDSYRSRFARLKEAVARFEAGVAATDRRVVLIVVPEHGAALRGSSMMPPDLRELPLPYLTFAPVGVRLLGWTKDPPLSPIKNSKRTTYLALASLLANLLRSPAAGSDRAELETIVSRLPETPYVAENQGAVVVNERDDYYLRTAARGWTIVPTDALPGAGRRP